MNRIVDKNEAPSRGLYLNSGNGPSLVPVDIKHPDYLGLVDPDTAFWALTKKSKLAEVISDEKFLKSYKKMSQQFLEEMNMLRFELGLSAVYFNPTERCNLNCSYCYIPSKMRKSGISMGKAEVIKSLQKLKRYFNRVMPEGRLPQIIFHGAEPMVVKDAVFPAIEKFSEDFRFGVQTNGTLLDDDSISFLKDHGVGIGLSLDAPTALIANKTRKTWKGEGVYKNVIEAMDKLKGYPGYNVICTVTSQNMKHLTKTVEFFHDHEVPVTMLNMVRCTLEGARQIKPKDNVVWRHFEEALDISHELFKKTGRKIVVANFANILVSILAPTARRLMCDISPCGGGRSFFALAPNGDMFPCSEFIGLPQFKGGNLFKDRIDRVLKSEPFLKVTERNVDHIDPCKRCAIRHFCGSPCPAEADQMNGGMHRTGAFCEFYEEQVRYAMRLIADGKDSDFLWDNWDNDTITTFDFGAM